LTCEHLKNLKKNQKNHKVTRDRHYS